MTAVSWRARLAEREREGGRGAGVGSNRSDLSLPPRAAPTEQTNMNSSAKNASNGLTAPAHPAPLEVDVNTSLASMASGGRDNNDVSNDVNNLSVLSKASYVSHRGFVPPQRVTGWVNIVFIIIADLVGTGIVGLPYTFSKVSHCLSLSLLTSLLIFLSFLTLVG